MQQVGDGPDFREDLVNQTFRVLDLSDLSGAEFPFEPAQSHFHGGQGLADAIVKFPADLAALLILRGQQSGRQRTLRRGGTGVVGFLQ